MEISKDYLNRFSLDKKKRKQTREQVLAEEIWLHFSKKVTFGMLMGLIKKKGEQAIREFFYESIKTPHPDHLALFLWKCKNNKVQWQ